MHPLYLHISCGHDLYQKMYFYLPQTNICPIFYSTIDPDLKYCVNHEFTRFYLTNCLLSFMFVFNIYIV